MREHIKVKVVGENTLHCTGCERSVRLTLEQLPGVQSVTADHKTQIIAIELDRTETDVAQIRAELDLLDYEVESA